MKRFICLLLVFTLCVSLFSLPANAAFPHGSFSTIKLINADKYSRSISRDYYVVDDQRFQTMVLAAYNLNFQTMFYDNLMPFSTAPVQLDGSSGLEFLTISFKTGTFEIDPVYGDHVVVGGITYPTGSSVSYNNLFYSVFPSGMNYSANAPTDNEYVTYYLPTDDIYGALLLADLSDSSIYETLVGQLDSIGSSLSEIQSYSSTLASYVIRIYNLISSMDSDISSILSYVTKLNTTCTSINDHLSAIESYENVSATQLLNIVDILTADMPTIISDLEVALDFLYSIDNDVYHIRNHLATIHQDLTKTNEYLDAIEEHLSAEALKGYDTNTGMNFFELAGNVLGNGFNVVGSFFSYAFMSISALLAPGLEGFDQIANIWSWNNSGYDPDYIVPDTGGG